MIKYRKIEALFAYETNFKFVWIILKVLLA